MGAFKKLDPKVFRDWTKASAAAGSYTTENLESWRLRC